MSAAIAIFLFIFSLLAFPIAAAEKQSAPNHENSSITAPKMNCAGFAPQSLPVCALESPSAVNEIWETVYWGREIDPALKALEKTALRDLSTEERIVTQSALFFLFYRESYNHFTAYMPPKEIDAFKQRKFRLAKQVQRLALKGEILDNLGTQPDSANAAWLGDPENWVERGTRQSPLMHESFFGLAFRFRPIKTKKFRAIFSQCVAIDTAWKIHVTPIVAGIEALHGKTLTEKACVAHLDAARLRCEAATRLKTEDFAQGTPKGVAQFLGDFGNKNQRCIACHQGERNLFIFDPKTPAEKLEHLEKREATFLEQSQNMASHLKEWAESD